MSAVEIALLGAGLACWGLSIVMLALRVSALTQLVKDQEVRALSYRGDLERVERKANTAIRSAAKAGR